jgi:hypothetical protein
VISDGLQATTQQQQDTNQPSALLANAGSLNTTQQLLQYVVWAPVETKNTHPF